MMDNISNVCNGCILLGKFCKFCAVKTEIKEAGYCRETYWDEEIIICPECKEEIN